MIEQHQSLKDNPTKFRVYYVCIMYVLYMYVCTMYYVGMFGHDHWGGGIHCY